MQRFSGALTHARDPRSHTLTSGHARTCPEQRSGSGQDEGGCLPGGIADAKEARSSVSSPPSTPTARVGQSYVLQLFGRVYPRLLFAAAYIHATFVYGSATCMHRCTPAFGSHILLCFLSLLLLALTGWRLTQSTLLRDHCKLGATGTASASSLRFEHRAISHDLLCQQWPGAILAT